MKTDPIVMSDDDEPNNSSSDKILDYLGNIGPFQWQVYLLSSLPAFIAGVLCTGFVFTTAIPEHRCAVTECDAWSIKPERSQLNLRIFEENFLQFTTPLTDQNPFGYDSCRLFGTMNDDHNQTIQANCSADYFDPNTTRSCDQYLIEQKYFYSTVVTEFRLFCDDQWLVQVLQSTYFFGVLIGSIVNGILADRYGRKIIFQIFSPMTVLALLISLIATSWPFYAIGLFLKGLCMAGIYPSAFTMGIECLGGKWRFWLGNSYSYIFALGSIYACAVAYLFRSWKLIEAAQLIPAILLLPYPFLLSESIRWQFSAGRTQQALLQLERAAKKNGVQIPDQVIETFLLQTENNRNQSEKIGRTGASVPDLFRNPSIRKWTITLMFIWFTNSLVYFGLSFLASEINENIYLSMILLASVELPGTLIVCFVGEFSRRKSLMGLMMFCGCACLVSALTPGGPAKMWSAVLGKMCICGSFALIFVYAAEIFPTILRATGLGICSFNSRIGAMIAPHLLRLTIIGDWFPFLVIGVTAFTAGMISFILPETKDKKLPDSLQEVEQLKYVRKELNYQNLDPTETKQVDDVEDYPN